jgi:uncharacterized OB-fold protein
MIETIIRPLPDTKAPLYAPYYQGLRERKIVVQQCTACRHVQWPPRDICFRCHANQLSWTEMPQEGKVYTYSIYYRPFHPWFTDCVPLGAVVVDLGNGIRMLGNYRGTDIEEIHCDLSVKAVFEDVDERTTLLHWEKI